MYRHHTVWTFTLNHALLIATVLIVTALIAGCTNAPSQPTSDEIVPVLSPAEELATFQIKTGYRIELVASEPLVEDPVLMTFDEEGRPWVVEMRGFMPNIDGEGEEAKVGRISILHDDNHDGQMDRRTTFMDSLVLPRALAIVKGGALVAENFPLWFVEDTDGDLVADKQTLIDGEYGGIGLPEHSPNGLLRGLDNWYYNAKARVRYRRVGNAWQKDETEFRGQWGISQDDQGRLYYNYNWSQLHADIVPPNYLHRNPNHTPTSGLDVGLTINRSIYPIRENRAVNRGYIPGSLDEQGRLLEFTSASAPLVYRGTAMPELYGDVFVCEPAGNLIKRNVINETGFSLTSTFAYPDSEFLASTDERFRPVSLAHGPDGALYVVDMYRGVIQHGKYITPYLREESVRRGMVNPIHKGRIWRIVPDDPDEKASSSSSISLASMSQQELVATLSHEDGWYRDTAQRLLVEAQDLTAIRPLQRMLTQGATYKGRLHALWTLQGLGHDKPATYLQALDDDHELVQAAALRILGDLTTSYPDIKQTLAHQMDTRWKNAEPALILQIALTTGILDGAPKTDLYASIINKHSAQAVIRDAVLSGLHQHEFAFLKSIWANKNWQTNRPDRFIFLEMLTTAVAQNREPAELRELLAMLGDGLVENDWRAEPLLSSLSIAATQSELPIRLASAPAVLADVNLSQGSEMSDAQQQQLTSLKQLFEWPGHTVAPRSVENKDAMPPEIQALFAQGRQQYLTGCAGCHGTDGAGLARFAPPLTQSEWVLGSEERLTRLVLHGIEGPIEVNGKEYNAPEILPVMPGHSVLDDTELASILTYIRKAWGNDAPPIERSTVGRIRHGSQGRVVPWTAAELLEEVD